MPSAKSKKKQAWLLLALRFKLGYKKATNGLHFWLHFIFLCYKLKKKHNYDTVLKNKKGRCLLESTKNNKNKNRFTISMSDSVYEYLEKIRNEKGLSKSAMLTFVLEEYKKGQKNA